jgi:hypothetical protein
MNRKNLTAAVLAGLAGVAGIAGTAQAVNMNPDGLGQVLIYPYYTANDGNQTILSVVNTTNQAKAVKVRFMEGFNSREVLDFNLYLSREDVWVAAIASPQVCAGDCVPTLYIPDTSCTVPYLYHPDVANGVQPFLKIAYTDNGTIDGVSYDFSDGGPEGIGRAAEGHFEIIEMGTIDNDSVVGKAVTHEEASTSGVRMPADCMLLTELWTESTEGNGLWWDESVANLASDDKAVGDTDIMRNSGGLFGGASVVNADNGTMYSYDAQALQGFDKFEDGLGLNYVPGTIYPSLNSGDQDDAWIFFGPPQDTAVSLQYADSVDAVSAVFMHSNIVNEYSVDAALNAGTEWIMTFPTKNFYADWFRMCREGFISDVHCNGDPNTDPVTDPATPYARNPFQEVYWAVDSDDNRLCEIVGLQTWDREENTYIPDEVEPPTGDRPPTVSPSLPGCDPVLDPDQCGIPVTETPFQLCNEVNVLRFGEQSVFGTPDFNGDSLLLTVDDEYSAGWGRVNLSGYGDVTRVDDMGLIGLPITGFAAYQFENGYLDGGSVKANYGGLFRHKGLVSREATVMPVGN